MRIQGEVVPVFLKAPGTMPETDESTLADRISAAWIFSYQRAENFTIPALRVFDIEHGVEGETASSPVCLSA
jgi:hypothetical protein